MCTVYTQIHAVLPASESDLQSEVCFQVYD